MLSKVKSVSLIGLEGSLIEIQVDISNGIPEFEIVGLPDTSVKEAKKRIESAIKNSGFEFPSKKILINLMIFFIIRIGKIIILNSFY